MSENIFVKQYRGDGENLELCRPDKYGENLTFLRLGEHIAYCCETSPFSSRSGRRLDPERLDTGRIRYWLDLCNCQHQQTCLNLSSPKTQTHEQATKYIFLVDVLQWSVTRHTCAAKYVALSYIWGAVKPLLLLKKNVGFLSRPGSLQQLLRRVPRTIRDVMKFVEMIGERYLWVDCLCLVQDDKVELKRSINSMNLIYENAYVTVIAANGPDANFGLPRMGERSQPSLQNVEHIKHGLEFVHLRALDHHLEKAAWDTRGWT